MELVTKVKQHKLPTVIISIIIFGIIFLSIFLSSRPNAEELVNEFESAIQQGDIEALEKMIKTEDKEMEITKEHANQLVSYTKDDSEYMKELVFIMKAQAAILENDQVAKGQNPIFRYATEGEIKKAGDFYVTKKEGLFSSYEIYARPYSLTISTNEVGATLKLNDKKVLTTKKENLETTIQYLPPGIYTVTGSKEYKYADIHTKEEITLFEDNDFNSSIELDVTGEKVAVESTIEDVSIFVNGKDIGKKAYVNKDNGGFFGNDSIEEEEKFGPVSTDGSIKIHGEVTYFLGDL